MDHSITRAVAKSLIGADSSQVRRMLSRQGMKHVALLALVACSSSAAPPAEPSKPTPEAAPVVDAPKTASPAPKIEAAKVVKASVEKLGVRLDVDVAITITAPMQKKEWVDLK